MRHLLDSVLSWEKLDADEVNVVENEFLVKPLLKKLAAQYNKVGSVAGVNVVTVSSVKCHFSTTVTILMHQFEDRCHNSMH